MPNPEKLIDKAAIEQEVMAEAKSRTARFTMSAEGYDNLAVILRAAFDQAATGKGKDRHANGKPFDRQPILEIGRMAGAGFPIGQGMKKLQEAKSMEAKGHADQAVHELLGVIVYAAAAIMLINEGR